MTVPGSHGALLRKIEQTLPIPIIEPVGVREQSHPAAGIETAQDRIAVGRIAQWCPPSQGNVDVVKARGGAGEIEVDDTDGCVLAESDVPRCPVLVHHEIGQIEQRVSYRTLLGHRSVRPTARHLSFLSLEPSHVPYFDGSAAATIRFTRKSLHACCYVFTNSVIKSERN
jgi:hypothetical protein